MIQRIQSIYLVMTIIIAVLFLTGTIITFSNAEGNDLMIRLTGVYKADAGSGIEKKDSHLILTTLLLVIPALAFITIFLFKNRKLQMNFNLFLIILIVVLIFVVAARIYIVSKEFDVIPAPGLKLILPPLILISSVLSWKAIKKDDELVKSYDRLR